MEKSWKFSRLFCQDQDQDFTGCPWGASTKDFCLKDYITVSK